MNTWVCGTQHSLCSIRPLRQTVYNKLTFSFYRHQPIRAGFFGVQITGDAGLLPLASLRSAPSSDPRDGRWPQRFAASGPRTPHYAGVAEAAPLPDCRWLPTACAMIPCCSAQPTLSRWENAPSARELTHFNDLMGQHFIRLCGDQLRRRGEILLDLDSTDAPPTASSSAYDQHMYHSMLIFECHSGCLLAARRRPRNASKHARNLPMLLRLLPRLQSAFPWCAGPAARRYPFARPLLYKFCELFNIQYAIGIRTNSRFVPCQQ
jgi:Transposase DDE domain group 1